MKFAIAIALCSFFGLNGYSQNTSSGAQPDLPGVLMLDFGFNFLLNDAPNMDLRFWKSKGVGLYYLYDVPLGDSKFSFHPGIGVGFESYGFRQNITLSTPAGSDTTAIVNLDAEVYEAVDKSKLITHYVDIPLEFRFHTQRGYQGFMVAVGGKVGYLFSSYTKIKYDNEGETITDKTRKDFNLNRLRYGAQARIGFRGFNLFGHYMFSDLFQSDAGPQANNLKVGLSVNLF